MCIRDRDSAAVPFLPRLPRTLGRAPRGRAASIRWGSMTRDDVIEALRSVEDPELGMDIVELGLLYDAEVEGPRVKVLYSLTSMGCPAGPLIQQNIEEVVRSLPGLSLIHISE